MPDLCSLLGRPARFVALLLAAAALCGPSLPRAQDFPSRPMLIVLPVPPGSVIDWLARTVAPELQRRWKQPVVVENKAGAGGLIASKAVASAAADGHTLVLHAKAVTGHAIWVKTDFSAERDLAPLTLAMTSSFALFANSELPVKSLAELIAHARQHPGKLNIAAIQGSLHYLDTLQLGEIAGIKMAIVPYTGEAQSLRALLANEVQLFLSSPFGFQAQIKAGKVLPLAAAAAERFSILPDTPTAKEQGLNFLSGNWYAFFTTAGTPQSTLDKLQRELVNILEGADIRRELRNQGYDPQTSSPAQLRKIMAETRAPYADLVRQAGIQPQ